MRLDAVNKDISSVENSQPDRGGADGDTCVKRSRRPAQGPVTFDSWSVPLP